MAVRRFPVLLDGDRPMFEASLIVEYLGRHFNGAAVLIPDDPAAALEAGMLAILGRRPCFAKTWT